MYTHIEFLEKSSYLIIIGVVTITTPTNVNEQTREVLCQQSTSTMEVTWSRFNDEESLIVTYDVIASNFIKYLAYIRMIEFSFSSYEVAVGTQPGYSDIQSYKPVKTPDFIFLHGLELPAGSQVYTFLACSCNVYCFDEYNLYFLAGVCVCSCDKCCTFDVTKCVGFSVHQSQHKHVRT